MKEGWEIKCLGEICSVSTGKSNTEDAKLDGEFAFFDRSKIVKRSDRFLFDCEALIIAGEGQTFFPKYFNGKFDLHQRAYAIYNFNKSVDIQFVHQYFVYSQKYFQDVAVGATAKSLRLRHFHDLQIPLPSLPEQQRIVSIINKAFEAIDKAIENTQKNLQNAKELYHGYIKGVFETFDNDWEIKTLGDIGKPSMCKRILKHQTSGVGDIPFYKIGTFGKTPDAFIPKNIYNEFRKKYSFPKKGDILISASGTIGRRVRYDDEPAYFQDSNIVWIANNEKQVLNDYLYVFYEFCDWKPSKGATISRLYNSDLTSIKIRFPKSLDDQKELIGKINLVLTETQTIESKYQAKLLDLEELKKSILNKAFAGEL